MKIQTYSILVGSTACNAACPYCVSRMTPTQGMSLKVLPVNWRNFKIGCKFAKDCGVSTVLLTGKGEPTLFPDQITKFLTYLKPYNFPLIELQTNGIILFQKQNLYKKHLKNWYNLGLTTIAISLVHYRNEENKKIFQPRDRYMDVISLINMLHAMGFLVRLSIVMCKGLIDEVGEIKKLIKFAKKNKVEQLTIRPVEKSRKSEDPVVARWVLKHNLKKEQLIKIRNFLEKDGTELMRLVHGAIVYDVEGQNVCLTNCVTIRPSSEEVRQLIFFPDGHLRYDWQYPGAILL